jgi:hypothetical protein
LWFTDRVVSPPTVCDNAFLTTERLVHLRAAFFEIIFSLPSFGGGLIFLAASGLR